jgi:hypothetical protein
MGESDNVLGSMQDKVRHYAVHTGVTVRMMSLISNCDSDVGLRLKRGLTMPRSTS